MKKAEIGHWSFLIGIVLAILAGLMGTLYQETIAMTLIVLGVIIGVLNISEKEVTDFLVASIALLLTGAAGLEELPAIGILIGPIVTNIATLVAPAVVIVSLKAIYELGKK